MYGRKVVNDGIRSFSPLRENWVSKPPEDLPEQVTVTFKAGQTGLLDMKNPRAVHWAEIIDQLQTANEPVYVEIDEESNVITKLLIPRVYEVEALEPDEHGDVIVRLIISSAIHYLLKSDPNFETMRNSLQSALDNNAELLITETRDEHEIIEVGPPPEVPGSPQDPPPTPPVDPPVSEARAQTLFNIMNAESCAPCNPSSTCIPFKYPDNGCWARAHMMCHMMVNNEGEDPKKVWIRGSLDTPTPNHPDCRVRWSWHVTPTLTVTTSGDNEEQAIDPSVSPSPESVVDWKSRQGDPNATLTPTDWTDYYNGSSDPTLSKTNTVLATHRTLLKDRCNEFGPPPYYCTRNCFFIIDRNNFSDDEIEAMLLTSTQAVINAAFYVVVDGFSPNELGFTTATMEKEPTLDIDPTIPGMAIDAERLEFEYPTHLNRRQRLTWVYRITFTNTDDFTSARKTVTLDASISGVSSTGNIYLIQQPNPYELDGATSWLSTDLRVFQIRSGQSKFNAAMDSNPNAFITDVIDHLNTGGAGTETFENDISTDQQTSRLELSQSVGGTPVYNFAVAKVRYRSLYTSATAVRVFFRLFPVATTSLEYEQGTTYRHHESGGKVIPLLGIKNNEIAAIPCFAAPRIPSDSASMTTQTDAANVLEIPPNAGGAEVVRYFGCWLDINEQTPQFPIQPSPQNGPWTADRKSIKDLIRNEHQCLVSEIAFTPAPAQGGSTPGISDKLAQRNLAIVQTANPGLRSSRRVPQTFEIRPSSSKLEPDELMIDWGNIPAGSHATIYIPGIDANDILLMSARKYRSHRLARIDEHTLRCDAGGITYLPIPFVDGNFPGLLAVNLPEGIENGQVFTIVVRQVTGEQLRVRGTRIGTEPKPSVRYIVGSFQITIPVREKAAILAHEERLLSNLRWTERAIPAANRWSPVFSKYVKMIADRVDDLGGNSKQIAPSPSGEGRQAHRKCLTLAVVTSLLTALLAIDTGALSGGLSAIIGVPILAVLMAVVYNWVTRCRPRKCRVLIALLAGAGIGTLILVILALLGVSTTQLITTIETWAGITAVLAVVGWVKGCFK